MKSYWLLLMTILSGLLPWQQAQALPVTSVQVEVVDSNGGTSRVLLDKMGASLEVVAQQLFLDREVAMLQQEDRAYVDLLTEVGDRVLTGYYVQTAAIDFGEQTRVRFQVRPWDGVVGAPEIDMQFSGIEGHLAQVLEERLPGLRNNIAAIIQGASLEAVDWADGVLRRVVREAVAKELPEFKVAVDLCREQERVLVQVIIYPVGEIVRNVDYELSSQAVPNILLLDLKYKYQEECNRLRGLPLDYIRHHKQELVQQLQEKLLAEPVVRRYHLQPQINLVPQGDLQVDINLTSEEYRIWLEGYADVGREEYNLSGKAHVGRYIEPGAEVFCEAELLLNPTDWNYYLGYTQQYRKSQISYLYGMPHNNNVYRVQYLPNEAWSCRLEYHSRDKRNEYGLRYRIHEFLSAETVYADHELYLRLIGNL